MEAPSTRRRAAQIGISRWSLQRILVQDLKMFSYKAQTVHQLLAVDRQSCLTCAQTILNHQQEEDDFQGALSPVFVIRTGQQDRAFFKSRVYVNKSQALKDNIRQECEDLSAEVLTINCGNQQ
ncbi:hypothetical protein FF38_01701 [Lucilia cuprina]|uniref:Uncharacterized protein n=1 Tax=Lucilia cuprina TaxID=7375 RepID=A0A0L0CKC3_LUCCU|nr:hypothetical protein FF38_01701 [Lucilia cuprina]